MAGLLVMAILESACAAFCLPTLEPSSARGMSALAPPCWITRPRFSTFSHTARYTLKQTRVCHGREKGTPHNRDGCTLQ